MLTNIFSASKRAAALVQQILSFSRKNNQALQPLVLQPIIKEALKLLRSSIPATIDINSTIHVDCCPVMADPTQIHQILMNLCTNAYHAMEAEGGALVISLENIVLSAEDVTGKSNTLPGKHLCLTVKDNGIGMDSATVKRIFDPYFTTKETGKGTGIGLSVVHGIVHSHNGNISVYSEPGQGTVFKVMLPCIAEKDQDTHHHTASSTPKGNNETILIIDDEKMIVKMLHDFLSKLGYQPKGVNSALAALEIFQADPDSFDLIITDMTMPQMTGLKLAGKIHELRPELPIILSSGNAQMIADPRNISNFLYKPVLYEDLARVVRETLKRKTGP